MRCAPFIWPKVKCSKIFRGRLLVGFVFLFMSQHVMAQQGLGLPIIRNFTPKEYQAEVRNWAMVQDPRGVMYIGNNAGVLKFDGNHWRLIPVNNTIVRSLAIDKNSRIYVGVQGEIGFLKPNQQGKLDYVSLNHLLDSADRDFTDVWTTHARNDTLYFHTVLKMFRITGSTVKSWNTTYSYHRSFFVGNTLYLRQDGIGLTRLDNEEFIPVPGGHIFMQEYVSVMLPFSHNTILVGSRNNGLYLFDSRTQDPAKAFQPFKNTAEKYLEKHGVYSGTQLHNGNYAIGTITGGVIELSPKGEWLNTFDEAAGLQNNTALFVYQEKNKNLVVLSNGISLLETHSPVTVWSKGSGLRGTVLSALWHNGTLYAGTADGLYYLDNAINQFKKIEGISVQCWQLKSHAGSLLVSSTFGLFEVTGTQAVRIDNGRSLSMMTHPVKSDLLVVGQDGMMLTLQRVKGKWVKKIIPVVKDNLFWSIAFDSRNNLWLSTEIHGLIKIDSEYFMGADDLKTEIDPRFLSSYDTVNGLPANTKTYIFNIHNKLCAATINGIFAYDERVDRFVREEEIFKAFTPGRRVYQLAQDKNGDVWFESSKGKGVLRKNGKDWVLEEIPLKRLPALSEYISSGSVIYPDDSIVWFGTAEGLFRFNTKFPKEYNVPYAALIRSVSVNDSIRFWGNGTHSKMTLPFRENKLLFSYSASFFEAGDYNRFSYKLDGFDADWSDWTAKTEKEYTNLPQGQYTFRVKAKNVFEEESKEESYSFTILPPWYLAWWIFPLYGIVISLGIYGIVKWRVDRLSQEKVRLEKTIHEHTGEIRAQNEELIMQREEILSQRDHLEQQNQHLEESRKIIALHNQKLESAVEERTLALAEANHELSDRYRQLEQFSFIAAHNLRAPVARILGLISILDRESLANPENLEILDKLVDSAKDLDTIIFDLGVILNVQKGQSLEFEPLEVNQLINSIRKQYEEEIRKDGITIETSLALSHITTIPVYFTSILTNLVSNAIKYRTERYAPHITIQVNQLNGHYSLVVEDNGIGFDSEKFTDKLFKPFQRFHTHNDGKGLGMFLVKTQVSAMGGSISINSKSGKGTRVEVVLPLRG
jgi:signal transduction histidine kinase